MLEAPKIPAFLQQAADSNLKKGRIFRMILTTVWPIFFATALVLLIVKVYLNHATFPKVSKYLFQCLFSSFLSIFPAISTVRPRDTRPQAARTLQVHVFELGPKIFELNEFM